MKYLAKQRGEARTLNTCPCNIGLMGESWGDALA